VFLVLTVYLFHRLGLFLAIPKRWIRAMFTTLFSVIIASPFGFAVAGIHANIASISFVPSIIVVIEAFTRSGLLTVAANLFAPFLNAPIFPLKNIIYIVSLLFTFIVALLLALWFSRSKTA
jgi:uncharacterized membrane protein